MPFPTTAISPDGTSSLSSFSGSVNALTSLNAVTATGAGSVIDFGSATTNVTMALSGTSTSTVVNLEGSLDNVNFFVLTPDGAASTVVTPRAIVSNLKPARYVRANATTLANGNVTAKIMGSD